MQKLWKPTRYVEKKLYTQTYMYIYVYIDIYEGNKLENRRTVDFQNFKVRKFNIYRKKIVFNTWKLPTSWPYNKYRLSLEIINFN